MTVASSHNLQYVKSLGAKHAFDYKSLSVVDDIVSAVRGTDFAGVFDAISTGKSRRYGPKFFRSWAVVANMHRSCQRPMVFPRIWQVEEVSL